MAIQKLYYGNEEISQDSLFQLLVPDVRPWIPIDLGSPTCDFYRILDALGPKETMTLIIVAEQRYRERTARMAAQAVTISDSDSDIVPRDKGESRRKNKKTKKRKRKH